MEEEKSCKNCGQENKGMNTPICNSCSGLDNPSKWIPQKSTINQSDDKFSVPATGWFGASVQVILPEKPNYPEPNESTWPPKAKLSDGEMNLDGMTASLQLMGKGLGFPNTSKLDNFLGDITSDGERGYICTHCGKTVTKAHHIKPKTYKVIYKGQTFYMEKHICDDCMNEYKKEGKI
jgi:hypothetical protein